MPPAAPAGSEPVRYEVAFPARNAHLADVTLTLPAALERADLRMAVWTPGSYLVREFARHLQEVRGEGAGGSAVRLEKAAKDRWRPRGPVRRVRYRVYANELTVRTNHVDATHAFLNGAAAFLFAEGGEGRPCRVRLRTPGGWRIATALDPVPGEPGWLGARDLDELIDSPIEAGPFEEIAFRARGRPVRMAIRGEGNHDPRRLRRDLARIVEAAARLFGGLPFRRYLFILHLAARGRGGLEHASSSVLLWPRFSFHAEKDYLDFLSLAAHEFFHVWNVKRFRPAGLVPFDYAVENYTPALWVSEGMTEYYGDRILLRAGLLKPERYLERLADAVRELERVPGREVQSLREASLDAWIKYYRPHEGSVNSTVSYYLKGRLAAAALDLEIRARTAGRRSLDDVLRALDREFAGGERGFTEEDVLRAAEEAAGGSLRRFFREVIDGTADPELDRALRLAGLGLRRVRKEREESAQAMLGVRLGGEGGKVVLTSVLRRSPAESAGLSAGDEVLALDGFRVDGESLRKRLGERRRGDRVRLAVFREDRLLEMTVRLREPPREDVRIRRLEGASPAQRLVRRAWLGPE